MTCRNSYFRLVLPLVLAVLAVASAVAEEKSAKPEGRLVDSGSFGIFVGGRRVATETFEVRQNAQGSVTTSVLKVLDGSTQVGQATELVLDPSGNLRRYRWSETEPGKAVSVVEPDNQLLKQTTHATPTDKPYVQPFLLAPSTVILDDYFFIHRQLLAWRYLGAGCRTEEGKLECRLPKSQFPALIPRQHISMLVHLEYMGRNNVTVKGKQRDLHRFRLELEDGSWFLWLDDAHHLVRILIASQNTEVLRD